MRALVVLGLILAVPTICGMLIQACTFLVLTVF